jgi:hypothetical protein
MGLATRSTMILLLVVALLHLLRLTSQVEVLVGGTAVPRWISVIGVIIPIALAVGLWRENSPSRPM